MPLDIIADKHDVFFLLLLHFSYTDIDKEMRVFISIFLDVPCQKYTSTLPKFWAELHEFSWIKYSIKLWTNLLTNWPDCKVWLKTLISPTSPDFKITIFELLLLGALLISAVICILKLRGKKDTHFIIFVFNDLHVIFNIRRL